MIGYTDETELVEADSVIISVSQDPRQKLIRTTVGLEGSESGLLLVDENCMTTRPGGICCQECGTRFKNSSTCCGRCKTGGRSHDSLYG